MSVGQVSFRPQSDIELQKALQNELSVLHTLLPNFQNHFDAELEFDLKTCGEEARDYRKLMEKLEIESAKCIKEIQDTEDYTDSIVTSIKVLRKMNVLLRSSLEERERIRRLGNTALSTWINSLYPAQNENRLN